MNNSKIALDNIESGNEPGVSRDKRKADLIRWIEAIGRVSETADWKLLDRELFGTRIALLERSLLSEAKRHPIKESELYKVQGKLEEAQRMNLGKLLETFKVELQNIKKQ